MALVSLQNVTLSFGGQPLLEGINLQIEKNQRICLLGRNGVGKTTLMRTLAGEIRPDEGCVQVSQGVKIAAFAQKIPDNLDGKVFDIIASGLGRAGEYIIGYHKAEQRFHKGDESAGPELESLRQKIEAADAWKYIDEIGRVSSRIGIDTELEYCTLSGGMKRRALLARSLVVKPDVLLLDEPTNHLDIETIAWLEDFLLRLGITILFVTHDRMLLRRLANRIIELDRGRLYDWECDYDTFLRRKDEVLEAELKDWERFDKKLAQEEVWIRKGIKARRTRNEGRVRALKRLRDERKQRRQRIGKVSMQLNTADLTGKDVIEANGLFFGYSDKKVIDDFSIKINRGDKIGIIGHNGCGKTTLVKLLLGHLKPDKGTIEYGTNLDVVYYDQMRSSLREDATVWENVLPGGDVVEIGGRSVHIITYLQNFLFSPDRAKTKVSILSGGERNRVMLARLFAQPANVLVLDEPTNDLDVETLELLEELLVEFEGTVLLICHDRMFLNNVVSSTIVFAANGEVKEFVGGYDEWLAERKIQEARILEKKVEARPVVPVKSEGNGKLTFKEKRELEELPKRIEQIEKQIDEINQQLSDPEFYKSGLNAGEMSLKLNESENQLLEFMQRWEELEERNQAAG